MNNDTKARLAHIRTKLNNLETLTHDECLFLNSLVDELSIKLERKTRIQSTIESAMHDVNELSAARIRNKGKH